MIRIIIVDDHPIFIDGLSNLLKNEPDITVVGAAHNGRELIEILKTIEVDIVLLDINMPIMDGIEAAKIIHSNFPNLKVIMLTMYDEPGFIKECLDSGAKGYVLKNIDKDDLIKAIESVSSGKAYFDPNIHEKMLLTFQNKDKQDKLSPNQALVEQLTQREKEVLQLIAVGLTSIEIGEKLFISKNTVETHRKNLLIKLNAKNTPTLLKIAYEVGLV